MTTNTAISKQKALKLIEKVSEEQMPVAVHILNGAFDPIERALANAPVDDEPLSADGIKALDESHEWMRNNAGIPHERVLAELGITQWEIASFRP